MFKSVKTTKSTKEDLIFLGACSIVASLKAANTKEAAKAAVAKATAVYDAMYKEDEKQEDAEQS